MKTDVPAHLTNTAALWQARSTRAIEDIATPEAADPKRPSARVTVELLQDVTDVQEGRFSLSIEVRSTDGMHTSGDSDCAIERAFPAGLYSIHRCIAAVIAQAQAEGWLPEDSGVPS